MKLDGSHSLVSKLTTKRWSSKQTQSQTDDQSRERTRELRNKLSRARRPVSEGAGATPWARAVFHDVEKTGCPDAKERGWSLTLHRARVRINSKRIRDLDLEAETVKLTEGFGNELLASPAEAQAASKNRYPGLHQN